MSPLKRLLWEMEGLKFLVRNLRYGGNLKAFDYINRGELIFRGCSFSDLKKINKLHKHLRDGIGLNIWRKILYGLIGNRLISLIAFEDGRTIAFEMFYFKADEIPSKTIHEAFIGVHPSYQRQGLATELRRFSIQKLKSSGYIHGISTNITRDNSASFQSALKVGFEVDDKSSTAEACYLFCELK